MAASTAFEFHGKASHRSFSFRTPTSDDGLSVHRLIANCHPLDTNSIYCNLLQCSHFGGTSVIASHADRACGFISGYLKPGDPEVLFIWQVAVAKEMRGHGLALTMLMEILSRSNCSDVQFIETSINSNNSASWALFQSLARRFGAVMVSTRWFDKARHFGGNHDDEFLARIGPLESHGFAEIKSKNTGYLQ